MLQSMHKTATGFVAKLLMGLLVACFALWGIGDIFRSSSSTNVVKVGDTTVGAGEFKAAMDQETAQYRQMLGKRYSPELLKTLGIPQQVLAKLVQQKLVEEEGRELGIVIPDSYLKNQLRTTPAFQNEGGKFDANQYRQVLRNNGYTEARYENLLDKEAVADTLMQAVFSGVRVTDKAAEIAYLYDNEQRSVDMLIFTPELVKNVPAPTDVELESYYEENAENFRAGEQRTFSLVSLDPAALAKDMEVSDEDTLMEYQSRIDEFREPEKREVKQLLFSDEATAKKAEDALKSGKSMEDVAKEMGAINTDLKLGSVTASGIFPEASKPVFALDKNAYSAPVKSSFGWHIFQVVNIEPEHTRPLSDVKTQLLADIRNDRVGEESYQLSNTLQDDLAGGASLEEAAQGVGTQVQHFGPISSDGTAPDGTKITLPKNLDGLLGAAFEMGEGKTSNLMEADDGTYYAIRVDSVIPERTRALDEIKGTVISQWKEAQKTKNLYQLASGIAGNLASQDVGKVAATTGARLLRNQNFTRSTTEFGENRQIPSMMLTAIFSADTGAATEAFALPDGSYVVAKLNSIDKADIASENGHKGLERSRENLRGLYSDELYQQYMAYLREKHGVSEPNQAMINAIIQ